MSRVPSADRAPKGEGSVLPPEDPEMNPQFPSAPPFFSQTRGRRGLSETSSLGRGRAWTPFDTTTWNEPQKNYAREGSTFSIKDPDTWNERYVQLRTMYAMEKKSDNGNGDTINPEIFKGTMGPEAERFIEVNEMLHEMKPDKYATDRFKIIKAISRMDGVATMWGRPYYRKLQKGETLTWNEFKTAFLARFLILDNIAMAERKFLTMRQGNKTAGEYLTTMINLAMQANIDNEDEIMRRIKHGLNDQIKDMLISYPEPKDEEAFVKLVLKINQRLEERAQDKRNSQWRTSTRVRATQEDEEETPNDEDEQLRANELKEREKTVRCYNCGKLEHFSRNCRLPDK